MPEVFAILWQLFSDDISVVLLCFLIESPTLAGCLPDLFPAISCRFPLRLFSVIRPVRRAGSDGRETDSVRLCIAVGRTGAPAGFESTRIGGMGMSGGACRGLRTNGLCREAFDLVRERGDADVLNKSIELLITSRSGRGVC